MSELWSRRLLLALALLGALGLFVWLARRGLRARGVVLFRCLVPSWRFFDQVEPMPALRYRVAPHGGDWGDWREALTAPRRTRSSLWLNAAGNLHLAQQSLIEHLVADLEGAAESGAAPHELVSYRLVCALVEQRVRATLRGEPAREAGSAGPVSMSSEAPRFQFCLTGAGMRGAGAAPDAAPLFLSGVHGSA